MPAILSRMARRSGAPNPVARVETVRASIYKTLLEEPATARDLSRIVGIREADVAPHLDHLEQTLRRKGERLIVEPSVCLDCDFVFGERRRHTRPGRCPECRGRRLTLPIFSIERRGE